LPQSIPYAPARRSPGTARDRLSGKFDVNRLFKITKAIRQLGLPSLAQYARYQVGLHAGVFKRLRAPEFPPGPAKADLFILPDFRRLSKALGPEGETYLLAEANEIAADGVRLFGGEPVALEPGNPEDRLFHWTEYEMGKRPWGAADVKFIWEPARFGWAFTLGRAYHLFEDEHYAEFFWKYTETFLEANPPYDGPHWASAQEVGLRLCAFSFAFSIFHGSPNSTPERLELLSLAIATHASRIPATLSYARAQNNNHLLSEAAALLTAAYVLPGHPGASRWRASGLKWFMEGLRTQFSPDGSYTQNSANYHRLALTLGLWVNHLLTTRSNPLQSSDLLPEDCRNILANATRWLLSLVDKDTGRLPNLGHNDGALIFPLASCAFTDYRPVLQASALAFLGKAAFPPGVWDETCLWFGVQQLEQPVHESGPTEPMIDLVLPDAPHILRHPDGDSWGYLRTVHFTSRPGHADQLHLDLWRNGVNIALDAGTYLYNAPPPWENSLAQSAVHNTVTIDGQDQMTRAGKFLWLDWAQARIEAQTRNPDGSYERLIASHDGYRRIGLIHTREVETHPDNGWRITDWLQPANDRFTQNIFQARLHWLLPDLKWEIEEAESGMALLRLELQSGMVILQVTSTAGAQPSDHSTGRNTCLDRAGQRLYGHGAPLPTWGWYSPTYAQKLPALSFSIEITGKLPLTFLTEWDFSSPTEKPGL
jgi:hypothetical protein